MNLRNLLSRDAAENSIMQTITIAVSAILIAAGLVTAPGLINNARDNNATTDLANIAYAQELYLADTGHYAPTIEELVNYTPSGSGTHVAGTDNGISIGLTLSGGVEHGITVSPAGDYYLIAAKSESGHVFYRSSGLAKTSSNLADLDTHGLHAPTFSGGGGGSLAADCIAAAPAAPGSGTQVGLYTTTASIAVCDSTGILYAGTSDGESQNTITGFSGYMTTPESSAAVVVSIRHTQTAHDVFDFYRVNDLRLSDGMGNYIPLSCSPASASDVLTFGDTFAATCTATIIAASGSFWNPEYDLSTGPSAGDLSNPVVGSFGLQGVGVYPTP